MAYSPLKIINDSAKDGSVWPVLSERGSPYLVGLEELDGNVQSFPIIGLEVREAFGSTVRVVADYTDLKKATLLVTDARVVVYWPQDDKSGGSVLGEAPLDLLCEGFFGMVGGVLINAGSKALAAGRRPDRILAGQIRYPWMQVVGVTVKTSRQTSDSVRFKVFTITKGVEHKFLLTVTFPKSAWQGGVDSAAVAQDIARRLGAYRLRYTPTDNEAERRGFQQLAVARRPAPPPNEYRDFTSPSAYPVYRGTAYPKSDAPNPGIDRLVAYLRATQPGVTSLACTQTSDEHHFLVDVGFATDVEGESGHGFVVVIESEGKYTTYIPSAM